MMRFIATVLIFVVLDPLISVCWRIVKAIYRQPSPSAGVAP
jgi:hypothetical protein